MFPKSKCFSRMGQLFLIVWLVQTVVQQMLALLWMCNSKDCWLVTGRKSLWLISVRFLASVLVTWVFVQQGMLPTPSLHNRTFKEIEGFRFDSQWTWHSFQFVFAAHWNCSPLAFGITFPSHCSLSVHLINMHMFLYIFHKKCSERNENSYLLLVTHFCVVIDTYFTFSI